MAHVLWLASNGTTIAVNKRPPYSCQLATPSLGPRRPHRHHRDELLLATIFERRLGSHVLGIPRLPSNTWACSKGSPDCLKCE
jgi:hypothetical protein